MLHLFRRIRRGLLSENKSIRYGVYAAGEIILVVIGILIALQINNWNDARKHTIREVSMLNALLSACSNDQDHLKRLIRNNDRVKEECISLRDHIGQRKPYHDSLDRYFSGISFFLEVRPDYSVYESLKSIGMDLITDEELRLNIATYYHKIGLMVDVSNEYPMDEYFRSHVYPKHFVSFQWGGYGAKPKNYDELIQSNDFLVALDYVYNDSHYWGQQFEDMLAVNMDLQQTLQHEILILSK